jgi:hypothetical protein
LRDGFRRNFGAWHILNNVSSHHLVCSHDINVGNSGDIEGKIEAKGLQERRHKQLLAEFNEARGYWKLKEEELDRVLWRSRFGRGCGPVVTQTKV